MLNGELAAFKGSDSKSAAPFNSQKLWLYGGLLLAGTICIALVVKSRRKVNRADDLVTTDDLDPVDANLKETDLQAFSNQLNSMSSFDTLVNLTTSLYDTNKDRNTNMIAVSGFLDGLALDKIVALADMYSKVAAVWFESFANLTATFMTQNAALYNKYTGQLSNMKQCKKSAVYFKSTETNKTVTTATKGRVLGGILYAHGKDKVTDVKTFTKTPVPICSQFGVDEAGAVALMAGMNEIIKTNYLTWLVAQNKAPTMLSAIGI